ncbi:hypothetical protein FACS189449_04930 [Alphaproteobacteria bacterium]|nr:hypothetical protein FACS189449_04930 [Alphaproteobacteria bacterium]
MQSFLLAVHFILTISIIGLILLQKHDSDGALGSSGGGAGSGMFSVRGQANLLTRATSILMTIFITNCLVLAHLYKDQKTEGSLVDRVAADPNMPVADDVTPAPVENTTPNAAANSNTATDSSSDPANASTKNDSKGKNDATEHGKSPKNKRNRQS